MKRLVVDVLTGDAVEIALNKDEVSAREAEMAAYEAAVIAQSQTMTIAAIDNRLTAIDSEAIRPLRALAAGSATSSDTNRLAALEAEAAALRHERSGLTNQ
ncbi:MAG: hypothetical protein AB7G62_10865 [Magnetospirillum sp.]